MGFAHFATPALFAAIEASVRSQRELVELRAEVLVTKTKFGDERLKECLVGIFYFLDAVLGVLNTLKHLVLLILHFLQVRYHLLQEF